MWQLGVDTVEIGVDRGVGKSGVEVWKLVWRNQSASVHNLCRSMWRNVWKGVDFDVEDVDTAVESVDMSVEKCGVVWRSK